MIDFFYSGFDQMMMAICFIGFVIFGIIWLIQQAAQWLIKKLTRNRKPEDEEP